MGFPLAAARGFLTVRAPLIAEHELWGIWVSVVVAPGPQSTGSVIVAIRLGLSVARGIFPDQGSKPCPLPWWKVKVFVAHLYLTLCDPWIIAYPALLSIGFSRQVTQTVKNLPAVRETWVLSLSSEDHLEKEMTTHSSILDWEIPGTEEPGRLQTMRSQRVGHDWATIIPIYIYWSGLWIPLPGLFLSRDEPSSVPYLQAGSFPLSHRRSLAWCACMSYFLWLLLPQACNKSFANHDALCPNYCSLLWVSIQGHQSRTDSSLIWGHIYAEAGWDL